MLRCRHTSCILSAGWQPASCTSSRQLQKSIPSTFCMIPHTISLTAAKYGLNLMDSLMYDSVRTVCGAVLPTIIATRHYDKSTGTPAECMQLSSRNHPWFYRSVFWPEALCQESFHLTLSTDFSICYSLNTTYYNDSYMANQKLSQQ